MHELRGAGRIRRPTALMVSGAVLAGACGWACAQTVTQYQEDGQLVRGRMAPTALGPQLFGEQVNLYAGSVEFVQQDVSLPGNSVLEVAVGRRMKTGGARVNNWHFADWDLDLPHISGVFPKVSGWRVSASTVAGRGQRCSAFGEELMPVWLPYGQPYDPGFPNVSLNMPGGGSHELLMRGAGYAAAPATGGPYPVLTKSGWQFQCLPALAGGADPVGEGFLARAPDGTTYRFDWSAVRDAPSLTIKVGGGAMLQAASQQRGTSANRARQAMPAQQDPNAAIADGIVARIEVWLLPTLATDRYGNTVRFTYAPDRPWQLKRIQASDGRTLDLSYADGVRVSSVTDGTRTWRYEYGASASGTAQLSTVWQPDGSTWRFSGHSVQVSPTSGAGWDAQCGAGGVTAGSSGGSWTRTMEHPSGAIGRFTFGEVAHGRTFVDCPYGYGAVAGFRTVSLTRKAISGPGLPEQVWTYAYPTAVVGINSCTGCPSTKSIMVTDPRGVQSRHVFGIRWRDNEGDLLQVDEGWNGQTAWRTTTYRYRSAQAGPYPPEFGYSHNTRGDGLAAGRNRPQDRRVVTQQGSSFVWEAVDHDVQARPLRVVRNGPSGTRTELLAYRDFTDPWVRGLSANRTDAGTGLVFESHEYDDYTATRTRSTAFGWQTGRWDYHGDGTVWRAYDAAGRATVYTDYKRGLARNIAHPDGNADSVTVNDLGLVTQYTNAAGTATTYGYDAMGRLANIGYPAELGRPYHGTSLVFERVPLADRGLAAGHWRHTVTTGNSVTRRHFDALWRERLRYVFDAANEASSSAAVETRYDIGGRKTFESYPQRSLASVDTDAAGQAWVYDALGRESAHHQASELNPATLSAFTEYLTDFRKRVTNARGHASTFGYQTWDDPSEDRITTIDAPEGVNVSITRDTFGKPLSITRSGAGASATRRYVYDAYQRLCKTVEPESGATVQGYDAAGNLAWRASGQNFPGPGCETQVAGSTLVSYGYDLRNRLVSTSYGDGSQNITRSYTPDGLLASIDTSGGGVNAIAWAYSYNNRRLLTRERYTWGDPNNAWDFSWGIDDHGNVSSLTDPWGTMNYAPDALGRPTQVSGYASAVSFHASGALAGYTLANGIGYTMTPNLRSLPEVMQHGSVVRDRYAYDANGNVTAITDETPGGVNSRSMTLYDGLDRLRQASGPWGAGSFTYDALDNLTASTVGGRSLTHQIDPATNRLTGITGDLSLAVGYDANGNVAQRGSQTFSFDIGNRMRSAAAKASYAYDGHGRRNLMWFAGGGYMHQAYTQDGKLRFAWRLGQGGRRHVHLGDRLIAETTEGGFTTYAHTDALGSPVAKTSNTGAVVERTRYEPYGATVAGSTNPATIGFTGHVNDAESGLVYMQQRYYDPVAGRFLSVDPVTTDAKTGSSFNRYAYGNNNPYKFTDPDGRDPRLVAIGVIALGSGLIQGVGSAIAAPSGEKTGAFFSGLAIGTLSGAVAATTALTGVSLAGKGLAMTIEGSAKGALSVAAGATAQVAGQGLAAAATAVDATSTAGAPRPTQAPQGSNTDKSGSAGQSSKGPSQEGAKPKQEEPKVSK